MTTIKKVALPRDERGNDPNDMRDDNGYTDAIKGGTASPPAFKLIRLDEIIKNVTGTNYLVKPYLERDCIGTVFGDSDTYKSFIMLDFGLHIASGRNYHGYQVHQCPVVYIAGEGHGGIGRRLLAWVTAHGINPDGHHSMPARYPRN